MSLLKWEVDSPPVGRYRSFAVRGWPSATYTKSGKVAARITCLDPWGEPHDYRPDEVREGHHPELQVHVAQYHKTPEDRAKFGAFTYRRLKMRPKTLQEAKDLAERALRANPTFMPEEERS